MKYTQIPSDTFKHLQMNAGIIVENFDPTTGEYSNLLGATSGGLNFTDAPSYSDLGEDIDNCPKNTKELKILDSREVKASGTFVTVDVNSAKFLVGSGDVDANNSTHIIPRNDILQSDFKTLWIIGDYSDTNTGANAGYIAIKMENVLNTSGFAIQTSDKAKGTFAFEFTAHYSMTNQDKVPYELYIKGSDDARKPFIVLDNHDIDMEVDEVFTFAPNVYPTTAVITWTSSDDEVATVVNGTVTGVAEGSTIITASITVNEVEYTDTCTVIIGG